MPGTPRGPAPIRVLIAHDEPHVREALRTIVREDPTLTLVGELELQDATRATELAESSRPDVALVGVGTADGDGARAAREIRAVCPSTGVVGLSQDQERDTVLEMVGAGVIGFLVNGAASGPVLEAIRRVACGLPALSDQVTAVLLGELAGRLEQEHHTLETTRALTDRMWQVLTGHGLQVVYQPIVRLVDRRVVGFEALSRFAVAPVRGPDAWFAEAEGIGVLEELELTAIRAALPGLDMIPEDAYLSLNLSPNTAVTPSLIDLMSNLPGERIVLEITEHAAVEDYDALVEALRPLRAFGVRLAIDDVGAGFSSMRHILRLKPDLLKLDISLTRDIDTDVVRRALARALISFASEIGAAVVAEGIETPGELETLQALFVGYGQGYHLGRPAALSPHAAPRRRARAGTGRAAS